MNAEVKASAFSFHMSLIKWALGSSSKLKHFLIGPSLLSVGYSSVHPALNILSKLVIPCWMLDIPQDSLLRRISFARRRSSGIVILILEASPGTRFIFSP
jgi:hypothetical protein